MPDRDTCPPPAAAAELGAELAELGALEPDELGPEAGAPPAADIEAGAAAGCGAPAEPLDAPRETVEAWRDRHALPAWLWAGARAEGGWPQGLLLTEAEFLATVHAAAHKKVG
jgi:hypothetical protein